ncbi:MAG: 1,4-alpha-glucan branching enzyme [Candidatus Aminicenantes bacterium RBG_16_63_16]|nr:MAG: 1,4-alpha-glucan branching enzyme [Candidatus Aminicenantes bacterium RBG_16_63_16]
MTENATAGAVIHGPTLFTEADTFLFKEGNHFRLYEKLGARPLTIENREGVYFAVWAPNAGEVSVVGDFNGWTPGAHLLAPRWDGSGIWEGFIPGLMPGTFYKYRVKSRVNSYSADKGDPFAFAWEKPPRTASVVADLAYSWNDREWMEDRGRRSFLDSPMSIYEVHLGSWRRVPEEGKRPLTYREIAAPLTEYVKEMGFTHVEFLPVMEHPFFGSWGYQTTGYFAPTSRQGSPQDFMFLVDTLHQNGIGVILDWVPSHFPNDEHGLAYYDGTHLYEHADPRQGFHPDWKSAIFNHGRNEVRNFLISSALFWLDKYHADGLRVDAVASILYLDYSRREGEWIPNEFGGRENIPAIAFLKRFNEVVHGAYPGIVTIAEESTAWPMVTRPVYVGGLGFSLKWNMGWMHDVLVYISKDPIYRKHHHNQLTFSIWYAFYENFVLPLSHDEVVHGKGSLLAKMPGPDEQKFANLRLLLAFMHTHPGKKNLFMGGEFGQWNEWWHEASLDWHLLQYPSHQGVQKLVKDLNRLHRDEPALHELDFEREGFEWIDLGDWEKSVVVFARKGKSARDELVVVANFTPSVRQGYRVGVPASGYWREILNTDAREYGGYGLGNLGGAKSDPIPYHGREDSLNLALPPLSLLVFKKTD